MSSRYRITALIVCDLARKMVQILFFFGPFHFRRHYEEIGVASGVFKGARLVQEPPFGRTAVIFLKTNFHA